MLQIFSLWRRFSARTQPMQSITRPLTLTRIDPLCMSTFASLWPSFLWWSNDFRRKAASCRAFTSSGFPICQNVKKIQHYLTKPNHWRTRDTLRQLDTIGRLSYSIWDNVVLAAPLCTSWQARVVCPQVSTHICPKHPKHLAQTSNIFALCSSFSSPCLGSPKCRHLKPIGCWSRISLFSWISSQRNACTNDANMQKRSTLTFCTVMPAYSIVTLLSKGESRTIKIHYPPICFVHNLSTRAVILPSSPHDYDYDHPNIHHEGRRSSITQATPMHAVASRACHFFVGKPDGNKQIIVDATPPAAKGCQQGQLRAAAG